MPDTKHILAAVVEDRPGVLNRVASLFRRRGFNIESIAVGHTEQPDFSRMTIVVNGDEAMVEQVRKQLDKVIEVVKIFDLTGSSVVSRELALIRVKATAATRGEIIQIADVFRANIVDVAANSLMVEITGDEDKIDSFVGLLRGFGIKEMVRTGCIALGRGTVGPLTTEEDLKLLRQWHKDMPSAVESPTPEW